MQLTDSEELLNLVLNAPMGLCILDADTLVSEALNDAFLEVAGKPYEHISGHYYWDSFAEVRHLFEDDLARAVKGETIRGEELEIPLIRYGKTEMIVINFVYSPVKNKAGEVTKVAVWVLENTNQVKQRKEVQVLNEKLDARNNELAASNQELSSINEELMHSQTGLQSLNDELESQVTNRTKSLADTASSLQSLIMNARYPLMILRGKEWVVEIANPEMGRLWDKPLSEITGKKLLQILPEIADQPFPAFLKRVWDTGTSYGQEEQIFYLDTPSGTVQKYVSFYYDPIFNNDDESVSGIFVSANDITEMVRSRQLREESYEDQRELNKKLSSTNQVLIGIQEELKDANRELVKSKVETDIQRNRLHRLFMEAPAGICILNGPEFIYELVNPTYQQIFPGRELLGKPLIEALPELTDHPLIEILKTVYADGKTFEGKEVLTKIARSEHELPSDIYWNFIYQARRDETGKIDGIMVFSYEVTEQVLTRKKVEESESRLRQALESGEMATWSINMLTNELTISELGRQLYGLPESGEIKTEETIKAINPEYREMLVNTLKAAMENHQASDVEYPITNLITGEKKWLKATGKAFYDASGNATEYSGMMMDITERKMDEIRKNDFIGMVSHELKTPLTSMKANVQMLLGKARKNDDTFSARALEQADKQVRKMNTMINGFLNVSRLENGKILIDKQYFDMASLVKEMEEEAISTITSHNVVFAPVAPTMVFADRDKIGQVISNFLSNAVKYSPLGTNIQVSCITVGNIAHISVKDQGLGIKPDHLDKLFERYYRVQDNSLGTIAGFGIGLYLCAEIIQRHEGKIGVESEVGKGSTFYFTLPIIRVE
jgi:PAS domain S-box-containing protein